MSDLNKYILEIILDHIEHCEKRFRKINAPEDFVNSEYGGELLDAIVARLQAVGENVKRLLKRNSLLEQKYLNVEWEKIIQFRDFVSHHYEKLDYEIVFDICEKHLPILKDAVINELK